MRSVNGPTLSYTCAVQYDIRHSKINTNTAYVDNIYGVFTRCDRRGDRSRDRSPRRSPRVNTVLLINIGHLYLKKNSFRNYRRETAHYHSSFTIDVTPDGCETICLPSTTVREAISAHSCYREIPTTAANDIDTGSI